MAEFVVLGSGKLTGEITVSGSKNAALPLIFASLIIEGVSTLTNVPDISDVDIALQLISEQGASVVRAGSTVTIDARSVEYRPPSNLTNKIRASTYLMGALLSRCKRAEISSFGGCNFSMRPIDMHLYAARRLGAKIEGDKIFSDELSGTDIYFDKQSVGATVNALLIAARATGVTRIFNPALEPHVKLLISFLSRAGVKIELRHGSFTVHGTRPESARIRVIPDMIEAGTLASLSLITGSEFKIRGIIPSHLSSYFKEIRKGGAEVNIFEDGFTVGGKITRPLNVFTAPYPAFPTDLQPLLAPLMLKFFGGSITECVWHGRFGYLDELVKFGGSYTLIKNRANIYRGALSPQRVKAPDLRGGAALLITALAVEGESVIENSEIISRGYENIAMRLRSLGARLTSVPSLSGS
jgi:UDP-N-acetylglucosamine 1-carboxyvinyltransferase